MPDLPEPCTTISRKKRHLSTRPRRTLCGLGGAVTQPQVDESRLFRHVVIADLDPCSTCQQAAAAKENGHA